MTSELTNPGTCRAWLRDFYWDFYFLEPHAEELSGVCPISEVFLLPKARVTGPLFHSQTDSEPLK